MDCVVSQDMPLIQRDLFQVLFLFFVVIPNANPPFIPNVCRRFVRQPMCMAFARSGDKPYVFLNTMKTAENSRFDTPRATAGDAAQTCCRHFLYGPSSLTTAWA